MKNVNELNLLSFKLFSYSPEEINNKMLIFQLKITIKHIIRVFLLLFLSLLTSE